MDNYRANARRLKQIIAINALPNSKAVEPESGTVPTNENVSLKVGPGLTPMVSTMSVPSRNQSGSRNESRVQACKSVKPAGNGVPGGTIGLGAESHKKSPMVPMGRST